MLGCEGSGSPGTLCRPQRDRHQYHSNPARGREEGEGRGGEGRGGEGRGGEGRGGEGRGGEGRGGEGRGGEGRGGEGRGKEGRGGEGRGGEGRGGEHLSFQKHTSDFQGISLTKRTGIVQKNYYYTAALAGAVLLHHTDFSWIPGNIYPKHEKSLLKHPEGQPVLRRAS